MERIQIVYGKVGVGGESTRAISYRESGEEVALDVDIVIYSRIRSAIWHICLQFVPAGHRRQRESSVLCESFQIVTQT